MDRSGLEVVHMLRMTLMIAISVKLSLGIKFGAAAHINICPCAALVVDSSDGMVAN
jgi:hypothetical protein